jgi:lipopolysaccharide biosynthesis glycosyltransferase
MSTVIVTAADEAYAPLLRDLLDSLGGYRSALGFSIAVLDLGLAPSTRSEIESRVDRVVTPSWMFKPHATFDSNPKYLSRAARPFLADLVPGHSIYIWLDADTWVQQRQGLEWLIDAAADVDIVAVPTVHSAYALGAKDMSWLHERYRMAFGANQAVELLAQPYFNSGVMAIRAGSPLWRSFAKRFQAALDRWQGDFLSDQAVINATVVLDRLTVSRLPATANWLCHLALPHWNVETRLLVEPAPPFNPLLIVHNTFNKKERERVLLDLSGRRHRTQLSCGAIASLARHDSP